MGRMLGFRFGFSRPTWNAASTIAAQASRPMEYRAQSQTPPTATEEE